MNLPNAITLARIFLVPILVVVLLTKFEGRLVLGLPVEVVAAGIFAIASLTDWLDGYLARRRKQLTGDGQMHNQYELGLWETRKLLIRKIDATTGEVFVKGVR